MKDIHKKIHLKKQEDGASNDVVYDIAKDIASETGLICFDEMQVQDIADAMIIGRLFEGLFMNGVTFVVTSNRHPDELYKNGIQRESFIPFIEMFKSNMDVIELNGKKDYRMQHMKSIEKTYYHPLGKQTKQSIEAVYKELSGGRKDRRKKTLEVNGRTVKVPKSTMGIAQFNFSTLQASYILKVNAVLNLNEQFPA